MIKNKTKIVAIGGGTGLSVLLSGLKHYTSNITAVVNVVDDGGSSGRLREDLGMLPPGDIRACLVALANTETDLQQLFQYRFSDGELNGQSFGNLFLAAMNEVFGSFDVAVQKTANILAITGRVLPMTLEDVALVAELSNGDTIQGESVIPDYVRTHNTRIERVYMTKENPLPVPATLAAIQDADLILLGPGSLYTSVMPNLLVGGLVDALLRSPAPVIYVCNVMTQAGETDGYSLSDHVRAILAHTNKPFIDEVFYNTAPVPDDVARHYYDMNKTVPLYVTEEDTAYFDSMNMKTTGGAFIDVKKNYIRHNSYALLEKIIEGRTRIYRKPHENGMHSSVL